MTRFRHAVAALCFALGLGLIVAPASAADTSFAAPDYPSAACTPDAGLAPQQWLSSVGLPLTPSGTPAAQRIVIGEFDEGPNMDAVNDLLEQCGLDPVSITTHTNTTAAGASTVGAESTLDFTVVASALPANATITLVNSPSAAGWYGLLVNIAEACGLDFDGDPLSGLRTASAGAGYPEGGCIVSISYGGSEALTSTSDRNDADWMMDQLTANGVIVAVSAGDEGSGGCLSSTGNNFGNAQEWVVNQVSISGNIATFTTTATIAATGFQPGEQVFLGGLPAQYDGMYRILSTSTNSFTVGLVAPDMGATSISAVASQDFGSLVPQFLAVHPDVLAVGGTQWSPPADALAYGLGLGYVAGATVQNHVWWDSNPNPNCANLPNYPFSGGEGTGGGQTTYYDMPSYQVAAATANYPTAPAKRMMPDLAALAGWPMYALANWGVAIDAAQVSSGVATLHSANAYSFTAGEVVTVTDLPSPFTALNGTQTVTAVSGNTLTFSTSASDVTRANVTSGVVAQSCTVPCAASEFPWTPVVGTSAATPLVAIGLANTNAVLSAQGLATITNAGGSMDVHSVVYDTRNASAFSDVTSGSNDVHSLGGYSALTGYDMATGMGVPNFTVLSRILIDRLTPSNGGGGGGGSAPAAPTSDGQAGDPVVLVPVDIPDPIQPVTPPVVFSPGPGVTVSKGPLTSAARREVAPRPATRAVKRAPRLEIPRRTWRVPVLKVRGEVREFAVQIRIDGEWQPLAVETSNRRGRVVLPSLRISKAGSYRLRLIDASGKTTFAVLKVTRR